MQHATVATALSVCAQHELALTRDGRGAAGKAAFPGATLPLPLFVVVIVCFVFLATIFFLLSVLSLARRLSDLLNAVFVKSSSSFPEMWTALLS